MNTFILRRVVVLLGMFIVFLVTLPEMHSFVEADVITWRADTGSIKDSMDIAWISNGNPNSKLGASPSMLLGIDPVDDIDHFMLRIHCNGLLSNGNDLDSIRIRTFVVNSALYLELFGDDDTVYCHLHKLISDDAE